MIPQILSTDLNEGWFTINHHINIVMREDLGVGLGFFTRGNSNWRDVSTIRASSFNLHELLSRAEDRHE